MPEFIRAILEKNSPGATYEGSVFDRDLLLFHFESKLKFGVFDDFHQISTGLTEGKPYEFILSPIKRDSLEVINEAEAITTIRNWSGQIVEVDWKPQISQYQSTKAHLQKGKWVLVATSLGHIIFKLKKIEEKLETKVRQGAYIRWENMRVDLYAVV